MKTSDNGSPRERLAAGMVGRAAVADAPLTAHGMWDVECYHRPGGRGSPLVRKWSDRIALNRVLDAALTSVLDVYLSGATQLQSWYVLLINSGMTVAAADTMGSHAGWTENTNYSAAQRVGFTAGAAASQAVDNSGSPAAFTINANNQMLGGAGLVAVNSKGGSTGLLYSAGTFVAGNKQLDSGDVLNVTGTFTMTSNL